LTVDTLASLLGERSKEKEFLDTEDFEDNDMADIGGECGGSGIEVGSTLAFSTCLDPFEGPSDGVNV
jgi:hypothetical protein